MLAEKIINMLLSIIVDPIKSFYTVGSLVVTSYVPQFKFVLLDSQVNSFDRGFQHVVWSLACLVSISALYTFIEKHIGNKKGGRSKKEKPGN